ncbi:OmpA family protein [Hymenobacter sp. GOD-10R]|uniref:OmpA family protein n=1 Tax=Hymenobacter sp. GOD-10R TaxID=3093922 RepID=UPI002D77ED8B|nr:OmpA family protein [Hymenobacter sp. GOD-10R]WRQ26393.1 OmpA family protein [Hymenobacter sp. GOD-10R]
MKPSIWFGVATLLLAGPVKAQSLAGIWQGVETDKDQPGASWPSVMRVQEGKSTGLFGVLYQEATGQPGVTATFQVQAARTSGGMRLEHVRKLNETGANPFNYWCEGIILFTYDPALEKLTGRADYDPIGRCDKGTYTLYRVKLKSAATVRAGATTTIRVSGRDVRWYADADLKQLVNSGNEYRTKLNKATTFYLTQGYYPTREGAVIPITVKVSGTVEKPTPPPAPPVAAAPADTSRPAPALADTTRPMRPAPAPTLSANPVVLPTVLFKQGTPELLPDATPALAQLAEELRARPTLRLQVTGHTDRIGESKKNQALSEQRAEAVKAYLVKAGIAAERISTIGYGDSKPLYPSPDIRNRRVEVSEVK